MKTRKMTVRKDEEFNPAQSKQEINKK